LQRHKLSKSTPLTAELFADWKRRKQEQREKELAEKTAERAKLDRLRQVLVIWMLFSVDV
jgi:hypothetical protein